MSKVSSDNLLLLGKVIRSHGLDGLLRVCSYAQSERSFLNAGVVFLKSSGGEIREFTVLSIRPHKKIFLLKLKELDTFEQAERYRGVEIYIKKDNRGDQQDEYYWHELIGLRVYLNTGRHIGTIRQILPTGSNDIYVTREGETEFLIPAIHEVVEEIDLDNKKMIISPMEGLLNLNEI